MKLTTVLALILTSFTLQASANAAQADLVYSFVCNGKSFGACPDGANPNFLIQASNGTFYGTTANSGSQSNGRVLLGGTVFSLTAAGKFTLLHTFVGGTNQKFANGATPVSLTEGPDGNLYGLTTEGGNNFGSQFLGYGVLFRIGKNGSGFKVLHRFCSETPYCGDGSYASGPLLVGSDGNLYGTTFEGGAGSGCEFGGCGTIFQVVPSTGDYKVVASFNSSNGGGFPLGMIAAADGTFYGLTVNGNALFQFSPSDSTLTSVSLPFPFPAGCPGLACFAANPLASGPNGDLYGFYTVYDVNGAAGLFSVRDDGSNLQLSPEFTTTFGAPLELLLATDGNFWSPVSSGGSPNGNIVAFSPSDEKLLKTLSPFSSKVFAPTQIIQANDGSLWGVASGGVVSGSGHFAAGSVFSLDAGLPAR